MRRRPDPARQWAHRERGAPGGEAWPWPWPVSGACRGSTPPPGPSAGPTGPCGATTPRRGPLSPPPKGHRCAHRTPGSPAPSAVRTGRHVPAAPRSGRAVRLPAAAGRTPGPPRARPWAPEGRAGGEWSLSCRSRWDPGTRTQSPAVPRGSGSPPRRVRQSSAPGSPCGSPRCSPCSHSVHAVLESFRMRKRSRCRAPDPSSRVPMATR